MLSLSIGEVPSGENQGLCSCSRAFVQISGQQRSVFLLRVWCGPFARTEQGETLSKMVKDSCGEHDLPEAQAWVEVSKPQCEVKRQTTCLTLRYDSLKNSHPELIPAWRSVCPE